MQRCVLNKKGKFGVKILWRYTDMAIFVLRCFILTHPVLTYPDFKARMALASNVIGLDSNNLQVNFLEYDWVMIVFLIFFVLLLLFCGCRLAK